MPVAMYAVRIRGAHGEVRDNNLLIFMLYPKFTDKLVFA